MPASVTDPSGFRQSLVRLLEGQAIDDGELEAVLERSRRQGQPVYSAILSILTHLDFSEAEAARHWKKIAAHRQALDGALSRDVGLRVALLDYFLNVSPELRNPKVIEIAIYERTVRSAITDGLTGLYNHAYFAAALRREVQRGRRRGGQISLIMLDLDDFKRVNDTQGHVAGDKVLVKTAELVQESLREVDIAARYGGEEFAVVLPDTPRAGAFVVAERIRQRVEEEFGAAAGALRVTISGGVATFPEDAIDHEELVRRADEGLYRAKADGKNRIALVKNERREHPRVPLPHPASVVSGRLRADGTTRNASQSGILLGLPRSIRVGRRLTITIKPQGDAPIVLTGLVVRAEPSSDGLHEIGIRLLTSVRGSALARALPAATASVR